MKPRTTIRRKLVTAMMLTSTTVLILTGIALVAHEAASMRQLVAREWTTRAEILAANSTAALAFRNPEDARQVLSALRTDRDVVAATLYDAKGERFASYPAGTPVPAALRPAGSSRHRFEPGHLIVQLPVVEGDHLLGMLVVDSRLTVLDERVRMHILVVLLAVIGSIGVAFALSYWLQRRIASPIRSLAETARNVSESRDYSLRARATGDDEIGILAEAFNGMLGEIQRRDGALRASEAHHRAILESALDGIVTMDHEERIVEFNPAAEELFGYRRSESLGVRLSERIVPAGPRGSQENGLTRYLATGESDMLNRRLELTAMRSSGERFPVEVAIVRIPQEEPVMFTGFIRDITERKRAEREIHQLNADLERRVVARTAELEASNQELEAFSYSVSHDLRAPLRAIDGFSKALLEDCGDRLDDEGKAHLDRVRTAARQMGILIDDLLNMARITRADLHRGVVDLGAMSREIAGALQQAQPERKVSFVIPDRLCGEGDAHLLRVVLDNLLRNAWKFTAKHETARIEVGEVDRDGCRAFFVADDGAGFDMEHAGHLFAPFRRLHRQSDFEGTGVGLATVQRIIHRHGGRLWAESAVEEGATFYFTLGETSA